MMRNTELKNTSLIDSLHQEGSGTQSESLSFEDLIIEHGLRGHAYSSFAKEWVEHEIEISGHYFTEEIYKKA
ncbi:hypothetical protein OH708_07515 [Pseudomonas capsici]|uniref:hypothetical protein n=1 Tax=Pseudomonas capsici TaxID=2810614 RepID=UPI0021F20BB7|nr:hypothetical protein [Pseudomonas capsici]MCV4287752.1 hypothetical protein [Pseudomonas capsici]